VNIRSTQSYDGVWLVSFIFPFDIYRVHPQAVLGTSNSVSFTIDVVFLRRLHTSGKYSYLKHTAIYSFRIHYTHNYDTSLLDLPAAFLYQCSFWTLIGPVINDYSCVW
jgi:hypothetical protein